MRRVLIALALSAIAVTSATAQSAEYAHCTAMKRVIESGIIASYPMPKLEREICLLAAAIAEARSTVTATLCTDVAVRMMKEYTKRTNGKTLGSC